MSGGLHRTLFRRSNPTRRRLSRWLVGRLFRSTSGGGQGPLPPMGVLRVLVCKVSHTLGNTLLLTPLMQELERRFPGAEVDVVTRSPVAAALLEGYPRLGRVMQLPAHGFRHPLQWLGVLRQLRRGGYDLAIDADPRSQTGRLLVNLTHARYRIGFVGSGQHGGIGMPVPVPADLRRQSLLPVHLLRQALGAASTGPWPTPALRLSDSERAQGRMLLSGLLPDSPALRRPVIGIFANATGHKLLPREWWMRFLDELEALCPKHDFVEIAPASGRSMLGDRYPVYYSSDIRRLATVLSALSAYVSADCGVMHLANASAPVTIGLFGGTRPEEWGVVGPGARNVGLDGRPPEEVATEAAGLIVEALPAQGSGAASNLRAEEPGHACTCPLPP